MLKNAGRSIIVTGVCVLTLGSLCSAAPSSYRQIVGLEESRTLDNGRLAEFLSSKDRPVAIRAALAVGRTKRAAGIPLLLRHVGDADVAMRATSVYAIGLIGGPAATNAILGALYDTSDAVRVCALDATERLETQHAFNTRQELRAERLAQALLRRGSIIVRARAATAMQSFSNGGASRAALDALVQSAGDDNAFVRWHAVWALYRGYAKSTPKNVFSSALGDPDETVRIQAVRGLGRRADASAIPLLRPLLSDPSWRVREQTLESITVLRGGSPTEHLTSIPHEVQTPTPMPDRYSSISALPRSVNSSKPVRPTPDAIVDSPQLLPETALLLTGPAHGSHPRVRIVTTQGNIYLDLYPEWAPLTVENFLNLANSGYYDGNRWFRIVPDFVVQTGDPSGTGNGDAGYTIPAEENPIEQDSYVISMGLNYTNPPDAHAIRDSAGTQFYITLSPQLHLDRDFTVFGKVIWGFDVLGRLVESDKIVRVDQLPDAAP